MSEDANALSDEIRALLRGPNFAHIATVRRDGSASVTPVWVDVDGDAVMLNGMEGRGWGRHLVRDPRITVSVSAVDNPYECATLRGHALEATTDGAQEHFEKLFAQYRERTLPALGEGPTAMPGRFLVRVVVDSVHYQWQPPPGAHREYDDFMAAMMSPPTTAG